MPRKDTNFISSQYKACIVPIQLAKEAENSQQELLTQDGDPHRLTQPAMPQSRPHT